MTQLLMAPAKVVRHANQPPLSGTRNLRDNLSDLRAQVAANQKGITLLGELIDHYGLEVVQAYMNHGTHSFLLRNSEYLHGDAVQRNAEQAVREMIRALPSPSDVIEAVDYMVRQIALTLLLTHSIKRRRAK